MAINAPNGINELNDLAEAVEKGERCDSKAIYYVKHPNDPNRFHWVDEKPLDFGVTTDKSKTRKMRETFAVNVLHIFDQDEDDWRVYELRLNNAVLHSALETILEGYPGLTKHELKSFSPPFLPFIHRWEAFLNYMDKLDTESSERTYLELLQGVLEPLLMDSFNTLRDVETTGHVAFKDLPLLYDPGTIAMNIVSNSASIVRSCHRRHGQRDGKAGYYDILVDVVDWDGRRCGLLAQNWRVNEFSGLRALTALDVSPLKRLPDEQEISEQLIQRGHIFENLRGHFFMAFTDEHRERTNERVIVDARAFHKYETRFPNYADLSEIGQLTWAQSMNRCTPPHPNGTVEPVQVIIEPMTDEQRLLAVPFVTCFNVGKKRWERLELIQLHEISWAEHAFNSLVLDEGEKDILIALVDRDQYQSGRPFDDFIGGKGQGMIMLLCGPPGVGKTLTAETVSEHLHRPLYRIGAGDLGIDARHVEQCLEKALKLCAHFGAVLLIDEADVFLEARTSNNLQRNELVSVFLRLLEYYNGIMILTTNRTQSLDSAFESRVDITLTYKPLNRQDRLQVWQNFLATIDPKDVDISHAERLRLAQWNFNGRQIKSAIKTARILAAEKNEPLNAQHLAIVLKLRSKALGLMSGNTEGDDTGRPVVTTNGA